MSKFKIILSLLILTNSGLIFNNLISAKAISNKAQTVIHNDEKKNHHYINAVDSYIRSLNEKDLEGILTLFADNATVEDPVGSEIVSGKEALRQFYSGAVKIDLHLTRTGPVRIAGVEVAFPFQLQMDVDGTTMITDIIDIFDLMKRVKLFQCVHFGEKIIEE